ncbi:MAG: hypothetical protein Q8R26_03915 [bacterium]|nr:hypothetical protein [bacterium]
MFEKEITAKLVRAESQEYIEVIILGVGKWHLYGNIIGHCAKDLSANELRKVLADCEAQLKELGDDNVPLSFQEMMNDLKKAMSNRGIPITPFTEEEKSRLGNILRNLGIGGGDSSKQ